MLSILSWHGCVLTIHMHCTCTFRLVFVYMPRTNIHSIGKRGKGCGQAGLVGTCTCALYVWVHRVHREQSKDKLIDLYINLLWIHVTGISTDIHTSYVSAYTLWILSLHGCVLTIYMYCTCIQFLFTCRGLPILLKTFNVSFTNTCFIIYHAMPNKGWNHKI